MLVVLQVVRLHEQRGALNRASDVEGDPQQVPKYEEVPGRSLAVGARTSPEQTQNYEGA